MNGRIETSDTPERPAKSKLFDLQVNVAALKHCEWGRVIKIEDYTEPCDQVTTTNQVMHCDAIPTYIVRVCDEHLAVVMSLAKEGDENERPEDDLDQFIADNMKDPEFRAAYERLQKNNEQFKTLMEERRNG